MINGVENLNERPGGFWTDTKDDKRLLQNFAPGELEYLKGTCIVFPNSLRVCAAGAG